jgi:hypothetical protein
MALDCFECYTDFMSSTDRQICNFCAALVSNARMESHVKERCPKNPDRKPNPAAEPKRRTVAVGVRPYRIKADIPGWWHGGE